MKYLNPSDLMVCDYVFRVGYGIAEVFEVCATSVRVQLVSDGKIMTWSKFITPILITEEILEKNGFEIQDQGGGRKDVWTGFGVDCEGDIEVEFNYDIPTHLKIDGGFKGEYYVSTNIKYVHQLQHTLRNCGLKDVADNFKI